MKTHKHLQKDKLIKVILPVLWALGGIGFTIAAYKFASKPEPEIIYSNYIDSSAPELPPAEIIVELEQRFQQAMLDLEALKGENDTLNAVIEQQIKELQARNERIRKLLESEKNLALANAELNQLRAQTELISELNNLKTENSRLAEENNRLNSEVNHLPSNKPDIPEKTPAISLLNVSVSGQKVKAHGKVKKTDKSKRVDQIAICFDMPESSAIKGRERFMFAIMNPKGMVIAAKDTGFGKFTDKSGQLTNYTFHEDIDMGGGNADKCATWILPDNNLEKGKYSVKIFHKGALAGTSVFSLE